MFHDLTDSPTAKDNNLHVHVFTVATKPNKQPLNSTLHSVNQRTDNR